MDVVIERAELLATLVQRAAVDDGDFAPVEVSHTIDEVLDRLADADGLVNATPVGSRSRPGAPVPAALLRPGMWVADLVHRPHETELLEQA